MIVKCKIHYNDSIFIYGYESKFTKETMMIKLSAGIIIKKNANHKLFDPDGCCFNSPATNFFMSFE